MYEFKEVGCKEVWLANGYELHDTPYGRAVSFDELDALLALLRPAIAELASQGDISQYIVMRLTPEGWRHVFQDQRPPADPTPADKNPSLGLY